MIHKSLQTDIVGENRLRGLRDTAITTGCVRSTWVELGEQETGLRTTGVTHDEAGQRETVLDEVL